MCVCVTLKGKKGLLYGMVGEIGVRKGGHDERDIDGQTESNERGRAAISAWKDGIVEI